MKLHRLAIAGAALGLAMAPVVAQAEQAMSPAGKLSLSRAATANDFTHQIKRAGAPVARTNSLTSARTSGLIFGLFVAAIVTFLVIDSENKPNSP